MAVGEAVTEAHRHGVLHRDLKPANILIPKDGRLRVADFGLAQETGLGTVSGMGWGSWKPRRVRPGSARSERLPTAPEQWSRQVCTPATDVWALGTILHELIVGTRPYGGMSSLLGLHVCSDESTPISSGLNAVPSEIHDLVRCLQKSQEARPKAAYFTEVIREVCRQVGGRYPCPKPASRLMPLLNDMRTCCKCDDEVTSCIERLRYDPTLAIIGPSGAGKTSFVQAGLIPRLKETGGRWLVIRIRPGDEPIQRLAAKLVAAHAEETGSNSVGSSIGVSKPTGSLNLIEADSRRAEIDELAQKIRAHPNTVHIALARLAEQRQGKVLLLIDQLEEVFTLCPDLEIQKTFLRAISSAADRREPFDSYVRFGMTLGHKARLGDASRGSWSA